MTPPEHLLIGFSIANICYSIQIVVRKKILSYFSIVIAAVIYAAILDIDSFFGHYASKNVYLGHRGITHSLLVCISISAMTSFILYKGRARYVELQQRGYDERLKKQCILLFIVMLLSSISHLLADLPQPPGVWGGIPFFYPYRENGDFMRIGGWSLVGWYDYKIMWTYFILGVFSFFAVMAISYCLHKRNNYFLCAFVASMMLLLNISTNIWIIQYMCNSKYISASHWEKKQNEFLNRSPKAVRYLTIEGRKYFLYFFRKIK